MEQLALQVSHVRKSFGDYPVLNDVTFSVKEGAMVGLIGPSGSGKSVLLKAIASVIDVDSGRIQHQVTEDSELSLMFQEGALFDSLTVFDNVAFPLVHGNVPAVLLRAQEREEVRHKVQEILARVGLTDAAFKMPGQLSGGMRRRVSLARAVVARPKLVLLDDPTCGLDPVASSVIMALIAELHEEYKPTMVLVSHDLRRLLPIVDNLLALFHGRIAFNGPVKALDRRQCREVHEFVCCRFDLENKCNEG